MVSALGNTLARAGARMCENVIGSVAATATHRVHKPHLVRHLSDDWTVHYLPHSTVLQCPGSEPPVTQKPVAKAAATVNKAALLAKAAIEEAVALKIKCLDSIDILERTLAESMARRKKAGQKQG